MRLNDHRYLCLYSGQPALHVACAKGMKNVVETMVHHHVKVTSKDKEGYSALHVRPPCFYPLFCSHLSLSYCALLLLLYGPLNCDVVHVSPFSYGQCLLMFPSPLPLCSSPLLPSLFLLSFISLRPPSLIFSPSLLPHSVLPSSILHPPLCLHMCCTLSRLIYFHLAYNYCSVALVDQLSRFIIKQLF